MIHLYPYQEPSAANILRALRDNRVATDLSDGGAGKMYVNAFVAAQRGEPVGVVCPRVIVPAWKKVLAGFGVEEPLFVVNWERLRAGNTGIGKFEVKRWCWSNAIPKSATLIFDEAHYAKGTNTLNARMMASAKPYFPLMASATLAESPIDMRASGYLMGFHNWTSHFKWCLKHGSWRGPFGGLEFKKKTAQKHLLALHDMILPKFGSRIRKADHPDIFPPNHIIAEAFDFSDNGAIQKAYDKAEQEIARQVVAGNLIALTEQLRLRETVELLKVPGLISLARDFIEQGKSAVIFTNFRPTLDTLRTKMKCGGIYGGQSDRERESTIAQFQTDKTRCIIVNVQAGGVGVSLHDVRGEFPRVSLVCPTYSAPHLRQSLQRIHRAGVQSQVVQYIVYAANTIEEKVCSRVKQKGANIDTLNDGDLDPLAHPNELSNDIHLPNEYDLQVADTCVKSVEVNETVLASTLGNKEEHGFTIPRIEADLQTTKARKHAPLSPSKLKAKAICPGYINDPSGDSKWADRGTLGHKAVEIEDPSICGDDDGLIAAVNKCIAYKRSVIRSYRVTPSIFEEIRLDYLDQFGYCDLLVTDGMEADLVDWKFAVNWYPADSPQFFAYAIAVFDKWPVDTLRVHVPHPFRDEIDVETWTRAADYDRLSGQVAAIIAKAKKNNPSDYRVSAQCNYCGLASKCSKLARLGCDIARHYAPEMALPDLALHGSEITDPNVFAALLPLAPLIEKATSGWKYAARELAESGVDIPGYELAEKKGRRTVVSAKAAFEAIKAEVCSNLAAEDFIDSCDIKASAVDDLVRAASPRGQKAKAVERVQNLLVEGDIFNQGGDVKYLRQIRR